MKLSYYKSEPNIAMFFFSYGAPLNYSCSLSVLMSKCTNMKIRVYFRVHFVVHCLHFCQVKFKLEHLRFWFQHLFAMLRLFVYRYFIITFLNFIFYRYFIFTFFYSLHLLSYHFKPNCIILTLMIKELQSS
jgi:hypothetical protein